MYLRKKNHFFLTPFTFPIFIFFLLQVTVEYRQDRGAMVPLRVHTVVVSVQHSECVTLEEMCHCLKEQVVKAVVPSRYLDDETIYHLQPSGRFVIGGPQVRREHHGLVHGMNKVKQNVL